VVQFLYFVPTELSTLRRLVEARPIEWQAEFHYEQPTSYRNSGAILPCARKTIRPDSMEEALSGLDPNLLLRLIPPTDAHPLEWQ
jgi:hypothetical protein